jgi:DNA-binding LytR/AlgR family response regulator
MVITIVLVFYILSNTSLYLLGFNYELLSIIYAQQYFGREALYHILLLIGTAFYVHNKYQKDTGKMISGMLGRKEITIRTSMINWVEADDHYLKIYTDEYTLIKRSTLENMADQLKPDFIRIHRKFLVKKNIILNTERLQRGEFIILNSGDRLKVG